MMAMWPCCWARRATWPCTRRFDGAVNFIFQPAEEGLGGARAMIADGLFERCPADQVYALHNWPDLAVGTAMTRPGYEDFEATRPVPQEQDGRGGAGAAARLASVMRGRAPCSRSRKRWILPVAVFGSSAMNSIARGYL